MFSLIKDKLLTYLTPILVVVFLGLLGAATASFVLYRYELSKNTALNLAVETQKNTINELKNQLNQERSASQALTEANAVVEKRYERIKKELQDIPKSKTQYALDPTALRKLLCSEGLAVKTLCGKPLPSNMLQGVDRPLAQGFDEIDMVQWARRAIAAIDKLNCRLYYLRKLNAARGNVAFQETEPKVCTDDKEQTKK